MACGEKVETNMVVRKTAYAFNVTRQSFLATQLRVARSHQQRLIGLIGTPASRFQSGAGLWIVPCHGVHTIGMRYPIDVIYLDSNRHVLRIDHAVQPWRFTPVLVEAATVLELPAHTVWGTGTVVGDEIEITVAEREDDAAREPHPAARA